MTQNQIRYQELKETQRHNLATEGVLPSQIYGNYAAGAANFANAQYRQREIDVDIPGLQAGQIQAQTHESEAHTVLYGEQTKTEHEKGKLYQLEQETEKMKPGYISAQTASELNRAENIAAQTVGQKIANEGNAMTLDINKATYPARKAHSQWENYVNATLRQGQDFVNLMKDVTGFTKIQEMLENPADAGALMEMLSYL